MLQRADAFAVEGAQRWVVARIDRGCFFPDGSLALPPGEPFPDGWCLSAKYAEPACPRASYLTGSAIRTSATRRRTASRKGKFSR